MRGKRLLNVIFFRVATSYLYHVFRMRNLLRTIGRNVMQRVYLTHLAMAKNR